MPANIDINLHGRDYKCDHWRGLAGEVEEWLRQREMVAVIHLNLSSGEVVVPDGRIHVLLGNGVRGGEDVPGTKNATFLEGGGKIGFSNMPACPGEREVSWVLSILERALPLIAPDQATAERVRAEALARNREAYVSECGRRLANTMKATEEAVAKAEQTIARSQQAIVEAVRAEAGNRKKLEQLKEGGREQEARFALEYNCLLSTEGVERVEVADGIVRVFTTSLKVEYDNHWYRLGRYRIDIYTGGSNGGVRCFNLDNTPNGYNHPHVRRDGMCCLGNIADGVARLLGEYEFAALAGLMVQYLRTVNPGDWYTPVTNWPLDLNEEVATDGTVA